MENYKEKYEQALERARQVHITNVDENKKATEYIFPELKENKDEKIRKELIKVFEERAKHGFEWKDGIPNNAVLSWLEKQGEKVDAIENFNTEFERQISHLIASTINKEHEYNEGFVKWAANALLNYAKHELEKQGEQKSTWSEEDEKMLKSVISSIRISRSSCEEDDDVRDLFDNEIDWLEALKERMKGE